MDKVYVVCWQYRDKSAHGIIGYSRNMKEAQFVRDLLTDHGDSKEFYTQEIDSLDAPK